MSDERPEKQAFESVVGDFIEDGRSLSLEKFELKYPYPFLLRTFFGSMRPPTHTPNSFHTVQASSQTSDHSGLTQNVGVQPIIKRAGNPFPDRISVGRTRTSDIVLAYDGISKSHAHFLADERASNGWSLTDLSSTNGTFVDGQRLEKNEPHDLGAKASIQFASWTFRFVTASELFRIVSILGKRS